jgi:hypothetical protein
MKKHVLAISLGVLFLLSFSAALAFDIENENIAEKEIDVEDLEHDGFNIEDLLSKIGAELNISTRDIIDQQLTSEQPFDVSEIPLGQYLFPIGFKIIPFTDEDPFVLQLNEDGMSTVDEAAYPETPDLNAKLTLNGAEIGGELGLNIVEYVEPNTLVGCIIASVLHREQDVPLRGTDTLKFKIVNFVVGLVYKFKGEGS